LLIFLKEEIIPITNNKIEKIISRYIYDRALVNRFTI
jgi:hypothetical protein